MLCAIIVLSVCGCVFVCFKLENIGNFVRAITEFGLKPHDIFEANDLFENMNHTQVQSTLIALAGMVRSHTHTHIHSCNLYILHCVMKIYLFLKIILTLLEECR